MKKGCLVFFLSYGILIAAFYATFHPRFEPPGDWIAALIGAFFTLIGIGFFKQALQAFKDSRAIANSLQGAPPRDGKLCAAVGTARAYGKPLIAPFTLTECIAYSLEIGSNLLSPSSDDNPKKVEFSSFGLTPSCVQTPYRQIKLLGIPTFDEVEHNYLRDDESLARAQAWVRDNEFEDLSGLKLVKGIAEICGALADSDGSINKRWRTTRDNDISALEVDEQVIKHGEQVCILGTYNAAKDGLVPDMSEGQLNRFIAGSPEKLVGKMRLRIIPNIFGGIFFLVASIGGSYGALAARERSSDIRQRKSEALFNAVREQDAAEVRRLIRRGAPLEELDGNWCTPLMIADSPEVIAELIRAGADLETETKSGHTPLMRAAHMNMIPLAKALIDARVDLNKMSSKWHSTALETAEDGRHTEIIEMLRAAGAAGGAVTAATGTPLPENGGEPFAVCEAYLRAIQAKDVPTLKRLVDGWPADVFYTIDWDTWQGARLVQFRVKEGFANPSSATVVLSGMTKANYQAEWIYNLKKFPDGWKITREQWNTD